MENLISVFDTTITDNNLGNEIIMASVWSHLRQALPDAFFIKLPYLDSIGPESIRYIRNSNLVFFGGGNCLTSDMQRYNQWGIDKSNVDKIRDVILMGVGWWQYQDDPTAYTQKLLRNVLSHDFYHSVRDTYTATKLRRIGFENVLVTGCPSMWGLMPEHCRSIPIRKAENVLVTFTNYNQSADDEVVAKSLKKHYHRIFCWVQGPEDYKYVRKLLSNVEIVKPSIASLDDILSSDLNLEYVGTRLHAGIRALQFKRRTIILGIDNRATEISKDFNLPVVARDDVRALESMIEGVFETDIRMPLIDIHKWLDQFQNDSHIDRTFQTDGHSYSLFLSGIRSLNENGLFETIKKIKNRFSRKLRQ